MKNYNFFFVDELRPFDKLINYTRIYSKKNFAAVGKISKTFFSIFWYTDKKKSACR